MESTIVLSKWQNTTSIRSLAKQLRKRGMHSTLISSSNDDADSIHYDAHVYINWDRETATNLVEKLAARDIEPISVVNIVEPLIQWHIQIARYYDLPGANSGRYYEILQNKRLVRDHWRALRISDIRYTADSNFVDFFPAIVKPLSGSAASHLVRKVHNANDISSYQQYISRLGLSDIEMIYEEYIDGVEFSLDGPVIAGKFHPLLAVEKPEHDEGRHHDAGLRVHPPQQAFVREGIQTLSDKIDIFCRSLEIDQLWLHIEGRSTPDGRTELVEINPRPGGGMYPIVTLEMTGIDSMDAIISMSLGTFDVPEKSGPVNTSVVGWIDIEAHELGTVKIDTTEDDLRSIPGVIGAEINNNYRITNLDRENFFLRFAIVAKSIGELNVRVQDAQRTIRYRVVPDSDLGRR